MSSNKNKNNSLKKNESFDLNSTKLHLIVLFVLSFIFYWNSISNETALDDVMVLTNNQFVLKGIDGIPDIISHESFYGATGKISSQLSWRYRPLSLIVFAIEHVFFGNNYSAYHFINILCYGLLCIVAYQFLKKYLFSEKPLYAFFTTLLFLVHPMHTEVVANIKSLDEILALLFSVLFLNSILNYANKTNIIDLTKSIIYLLLALLSKESSTVLLALTPLLLVTFTNEKIKKIIILSAPTFIAIIGYTFFRLSISDVPISKVDIMNDPYLLATAEQKYATIFLILGKYLSLLFLPISQCIDYGYNQIPYVSFSNISSLISLIIYIGLTTLSIHQIIKRKALGFFISAYLISIFILSNAIVNIGPPMADRFLFMPSFFFVIIIIILFKTLQVKINKPFFQYTSLSILTCFVLFSFMKVYSRNQDWKNNDTLYQADLKKSPNSVRMLTYHGGMLVTQTDSIQDSIQKSTALKLAVKDFEKAYKIYPAYSNMYQNWGLAYLRNNNLDSAEWAWSKLKELKPDSKFIAMNKNLIATTRFNYWNKKYDAALPRQNFSELLPLYRNAISYYDVMPGSWILLGQLYFVNNKKDSANWAWNECLKRDSTNVKAKKLLVNPVWQ